jgi:hypothetical protein
MAPEQYYIEYLSPASYLIGDERTGRAIVVDRRRDKDTWVSVSPGVGRHVSSVMKSVTASERCTCDYDSVRRSDRNKASSGLYAGADRDSLAFASRSNTAGLYTPVLPNKE